MKFIPSSPKPATRISLATLRKTIADVNKPTAAKDVGDGTVKVYMSGRVNHYIERTRGLRDLLIKHGVEI